MQKTSSFTLFLPSHNGYLFSYSDYGMIYNTSLRRQMSIDGNGVISDGVDSAAVSFNYPTSGSSVLTDAPAFTQRTETATNAPTGTYYYFSSVAPDNSMQFAVVRPDGNQLIMARYAPYPQSNGLIAYKGIYLSNWARVVVDTFSYTTDPGGSPQVGAVYHYDETRCTDSNGL